MIRRTFLSTSALALAGFFVHVPSKSGAEIPDDNYAHIPNYFKFLDAGFLPDSDLPSNLAERIALEEDAYKALGFSALDQGVFTFSNRVVSRVVHLSTPELGVLATSVMFFTKNASGEWRKYDSFSGFQVEAIVEEILSSQGGCSSKELRRFWLPIESKSANLVPDTYLTAAGEISISTEIKDRYVRTKIKRSAPASEAHFVQTFGLRRQQRPVKSEV